jgi:hypothetical protein
VAEELELFNGPCRENFYKQIRNVMNSTFCPKIGEVRHCDAHLLLHYLVLQRLRQEHRFSPGETLFKKALGEAGA